MISQSKSASASGTSILAHVSAGLVTSSAAVSIFFFAVLTSTVFITFDEKSVGVGEHTFSDPQRLCRKVSNFNSSSMQPDILVLGSSLSLTPAMRADNGESPDELSGVERKLRVHDYAKADYFRAQLKEKVGKEVSIFNLSLPAAMISDDYVVLRSALMSGKRPQVVVLAVSPRDFVSNVRQKHKDEYIYRALGVYDDVDGNVINNSSLGRSSVTALNTARRTLFLLQSKAKTESVAMLDALPVYQYAKPPDKEKKKHGKNEEKICTDIYRAHYNPPNLALLNEQSSYFKRILSLGETYGFQTIVVDMPLRSDNLPMMNPAFLAQYRASLHDIANQHSAKLVELSADKIYSDNFFFDIAHLNGDGGRLFFRELAGIVSGDSKIASSLGSRL